MTKKQLTLGWAVIDWIEQRLVHGPGDVQGQPIELTDEQCRFLLAAYALNREGRRLIRRAFISRPKGWAKSEFAGMVVCAEALGPVRFDHMEGGEPVGRSVTAPEILCVATEESQAGNTYDNVVYMLRHLAANSPEHAGLDVGLTRTFLPGGGEIMPVSAKARSKDGGKSTFVVFDETHLYETTELRALHATVRRNLGKRTIAEPWSLETSTMYRPGMNSVAEATHEYAKQIADGRRKDDGLLFDHREGPADFDWDDDEALKAAILEAYGDANWVDPVRLIAEIRDPQSEEADSRRYWLNQVVKATEQAFDPALWAERVAAETVVADKQLITLGFDGARFHDATALIATHVESGYQWPLGIWERPPEAGDDWEIDQGDVDAVLAQAFEQFDVWRLYADPPYWEEAVNTWAGRYGDKRVLFWYTNRVRQMAFALRGYNNAIRAGDLSHDGNTAFARHIANARRRDTRMRDEDGRLLWVIQKEHPMSPNKIDAAMAGCLSWEARGDAIKAGATQRKRRGMTTWV